ncbi:MAG: sugar ABC transporter substrate-binding protein [Bacteroidetes bacterium]|nr:hypothetical protein AWN76_002995 [Rhodothermaceae bacterium RA]RMH55170.1 MAG: sugar ABC transporter substrate-binding protein [Bacteroidota bacterium]
MPALAPRGLLLLLPFLLLACGGSDGNRPASTTDRPVIGVSVLTLTHSFFQDLTAALEAEADAHGFDVVITACEFDIARQKNQVSDFVVRQVDAIVLAPCDSRAIGTSILEANAAGIPVFTTDIAALSEGIDVVTHVATDNYEGGRLAAQAVLDAIGGSGQIAIIDHPEVESVIMRTNGFFDELEARSAPVEVVARLPGGGVKDRAFRVAEDILQAHPDLDAIFAINDDTALGAVAAIEKAGRAGTVRVVGFDGTLEARRAIRDGQIFADVIQHPDRIGRETVQAIVRYMNGEPVEDEILIAPSLYTQQDALADPLLQESE